MGRKTFYFGELKRMIVAENITVAYRERKKAKDWAEWTDKNPILAGLLFEAEKLCQ